MVNTAVVSEFAGGPPLAEGACRVIAGGPLYPAAKVLALLAGSGARAVRVWTEKCDKDIQKCSMDTEDLCELMATAVRSGRFRGAEWCVQRPNGPWAACDAYSVVRREWIAHAHKEFDVEYYIKFAIAKTGQLLLVASCHLPEDRR